MKQRMRKFTKILLYIMFLVLLTAEKCSDSRVAAPKEYQMNNTFSDIEKNFANDELSDVVLSAFEKRAVQKLEDISDYINIYADTSLSVQFRAQANQMILDNFLEKMELQIFYENLELQEDTLNTTLYHSKNGHSFKIEIGSIEITNHFLKKSDLSYSGEIQFNLRMEVSNTLGAIEIKDSQYSVKMLAIKSTKNFGNETEEVWEVYLADSKALPNI